MKHPGGRPLTWTDPSQLQELIDKYFKTEKWPTLSGLAYFIGIDRNTLYNYEKKDQFFSTIKKARDRMLLIYERLLIHRDQNPAGVIFALKNTGWKDRQDITTNDKDLPTPILSTIVKETS